MANVTKINVKNNFNNNNSFVTVSRKEFIKKEKEEKKQEEQNIIESLIEGQTYQGKVKNIMDYGVFVTVNGVDGLIPNKELSWEFFNDANTIVSINEEIPVKLIKKEDKKITFSYKEVCNNPWNEVVPTSLYTGQTIKVRIKQKINKGLIVNPLQNNLSRLSAFIPKKEIAGKYNIEQTYNNIKEGDVYNVIVIKFAPENRNFICSIKETFVSEWDNIDPTIQPGTIILAEVSKIHFNYIYLNIGFNSIIGYMPKREVFNSPKMFIFENIFKIGQKIKVAIMELQKEKNRIIVSFKQANKNTNYLSTEYIPNQKIAVEICKIEDNGILGKVNDEVSVLIPQAEVSWKKNNAYALKKYKPGDTIETIIIERDHEKNRLIASIKAIQDNPWLSFQIGSKYNGEVTGYTKTVYFVTFENGIAGVLPKSDSYSFKKGDRIDCFIETIDIEEERMKLKL